MSDAFISEFEELKIIYSEIIQGYSHFKEENIWIKHLTDLETSLISKKRNELYQSYIKDGLPNESDKLNQIIDLGLWSKEKEEEILNLKFAISDNEKGLSKIIIQQRPKIQKLIDDNKIKLKSLLEEKRGLIGATANEYAEKNSFNFIISLLCHKDEALKTKLFTFEDVLDLDYKEMEKYSDMFEYVFARFSDHTLKKISVLPFFLNAFSYCKDAVWMFIGRSIVDFTLYQNNLFGYGVRNLNILSACDLDPPELIGDTKIDDIVMFFDKQLSLAIGKKNTVRKK